MSGVTGLAPRAAARLATRRATRWATRWTVGIAAAAIVAFAADSAVTYPDVVPGQPLEFPRDEGSHPEYRTEWWYVTGWLEGAGDAPVCLLYTSPSPRDS